MSDTIDYLIKFWEGVKKEAEKVIAKLKELKEKEDGKNDE